MGSIEMLGGSFEFFDINSQKEFSVERILVIGMGIMGHHPLTC